MTYPFSEEFVNSSSEKVADALSPKQQKYINSDKTPEKNDIVIRAYLVYTFTDLRASSTAYRVKEVNQNTLTLEQIEEGAGLGEYSFIETEDLLFVRHDGALYM